MKLLLSTLALALVAALGTTTAGAEPPREHGEVVRGRLYVASSHGLNRGWNVVIHSAVSPGGLRERGVQSDGRFELRLLPGTYRFTAHDLGTNPPSVQRCGSVRLTIRAHKRTSLVRIHCNVGG